MLLDLPEDVWRNVAFYLIAPDVLSLLTVHRLIHNGLGKSEAFWKLLLERDSYPYQNIDTTDDDDDDHNLTAPVLTGTETDDVDMMCHSTRHSTLSSMEALRRLYMKKAYMNHLPVVKWYPLRNGYQTGVSPREGHLACILGSGEHRKICINGGFTDDDAIYVLHAPCTTPTARRTTTTAAAVTTASSSERVWRWERIMPRIGEGMVGFVYGSTLTALDSTRAVRFGGFRAGGYSHETNQVSLLTLTEHDTANTATTGRKQLKASYEVIPTTNATFGTARAYHTATLLAERYLVIIGGMMWRGSFLKEAILDTHTWTWLEGTVSFGLGENSRQPSGRHGHSVILDEKRNRLVLFGGGNGSNLLRSGVDNTEVWELELGENWRTDLVASLPWKWRQIHTDVVSLPPPSDEDDDNEEIASATASLSSSSSSPQLSRAEALCLGRCHNGIRVSPDMVLFVLGSGRPSTNGVLAYDLQRDQFVRPRVRGPLPQPRHSGVAAFLEEDGYLFLHGGYTVRDGDAIGDMSILDLAPNAKRLPNSSSSSFDKLNIDTEYESFREITNEDAMGDGYRSSSRMDVGMLFSLLNQPEISREIMMNGTGDLAERSMLLMNLFASGALASSSGGEDDAEDSDEEEEDEDNDDDEEEEEDEYTDMDELN